jgi:hypothetical protein
MEIKTFLETFDFKELKHKDIPYVLIQSIVCLSVNGVDLSCEEEVAPHMVEVMDYIAEKKEIKEELLDIYKYFLVKQISFAVNICKQSPQLIKDKTPETKVEIKHSSILEEIAKDYPEVYIDPEFEKL